MKLSNPQRLLAELPPESKILIVRLRSLGDLVLETPVIAALHAWRPDLRISVLAEPRFEAVFDGNEAISGLIKARGFGETAREVRRGEFAAVFNQHGGPRSALLTAASSSERRVCWKGFQFSWAYNVLVPDAREFYGRAIVHTVEHRISQFYGTGLPRGPIARAQVFPQARAMRAVQALMAEKGIDGATPYAVLQPGGRLASMRWPAEKFAEVARRLKKTHGVSSVVNLGAGDAEVMNEAQHELGKCALILEGLGLPKLIALVGGARILVGNDSGPGHLAAATGRPAVLIYGPTNPAQWHPWQSEYRAVHTDAVFNPRRGDKTTAEREARPIGSIGVEEVWAACDELLTATASESAKTGDGG